MHDDMLANILVDAIKLSKGEVGQSHDRLVAIEAKDHVVIDIIQFKIAHTIVVVVVVFIGGLVSVFLDLADEGNKLIMKCCHACLCQVDESSSMRGVELRGHACELLASAVRLILCVFCHYQCRNPPEQKRVLRIPFTEPRLYVGLKHACCHDSICFH
jgi:hypothetical protein